MAENRTLLTRPLDPPQAGDASESFITFNSSTHSQFRTADSLITAPGFGIAPQPRHPGPGAITQVNLQRATEGPPREVFFAQEHRPGELCQSDFTHCRELGVTIDGQAFPHLMYHFVLTYSNWETGSICYSETFESLSEGLQNALWQLGGVPAEHRTDRMSAAVNTLSDAKEFTRAYEGLLRHYRIGGQKIQACQANENGDIEQRHYRFKEAADQALMMRGSRDFPEVVAYQVFLDKLFTRLNAGRRERYPDEVPQLPPLPAQQLDSYGGNWCESVRAVWYR